MRTRILLIGLFVFAGSLSAQKSVLHDADLFDACFNDERSLYIDFPLLVKTYKLIKMAEAETYKEVLGKKLSKGNSLVGVNPFQYGEAFLLDSLYTMLQEQGFPGRKSLKERMQQNILRFRQEASSLPSFYKIIDQQFSGDVNAYVNYLFEYSAFANREWFIWLFSSEQIAKDPLISFFLSLWMHKARLLEKLFKNT